MSRADYKWVVVGLAIGLWGLFNSTMGDFSRVSSTEIAATLGGAIIGVLAIVYFARWVNRPKS